MHPESTAVGRWKWVRRRCRGQPFHPHAGQRRPLMGRIGRKGSCWDQWRGKQVLYVPSFLFLAVPPVPPKTANNQKSRDSFSRRKPPEKVAVHTVPPRGTLCPATRSTWVAHPSTVELPPPTLMPGCLSRPSSQPCNTLNTAEWCFRARGAWGGSAAQLVPQTNRARYRSVGPL